MARTRRWIPVLAVLILLGFSVLGFFVEVGVDRGNEMIASAATYRAGPLSRPATFTSLDWPSNADELFALGLIAATLCGFRASGLARNSVLRSRVSPRNPRMG